MNKRIAVLYVFFCVIMFVMFVEDLPAKKQHVKNLNMEQTGGTLYSPGLHAIKPQFVRLTSNKTDEFSFTIDKGQPEYYHDFRTTSAGAISVDILFSGKVKLEALLIPPGDNPDPVTQESGEKTIRFRTEINPAMMRDGNKWTILIRIHDTQKNKNKGKSIISPHIISGKPVRGIIRVTYPALLQLRPSPYVPILIESMRNSLNKKGPKEWTTLLNKHPQLKPLLQNVLNTYDMLPGNTKNNLYGGPFFAGGLSSAHSTEARLSGFSQQMSMSLGMQSHQMAKPVPVINNIFPEKPLANNWLLITGNGFIFPGKLTVVILQRKGKDGKMQSLPLKEGETLNLQNNLIRLKLPRNTDDEDIYQVTISHAGGTAKKEFVVYASAHLIRKFSGRIKQVRCVDESNPEWAGSDEVYAVIAVLQVNEKTTADWQFKTETVHGFDDGDRKDVNWMFFDQYNQPNTLGNGVLLTVFLVEDDPGSPPDGMQDLIRTVMTEVTRSISLMESGMEGNPLSALVGSIFADVLGAFIDLIFSALEDDPLGVESQFFVPPYLYDWVTSNGGVFSRSLHFNNDSDTGSYQTMWEWILR